MKKRILGLALAMLLSAAMLLTLIAVRKRAASKF